MNSERHRFSGWPLTPTLTVALLASLPLSSQQRQYSEPGSLLESEVAASERVQKQLEGAPWKFGNIRIQPRLGLSDLQYVNNVFDRGDEDMEGTTSDLRLTALAGLDAYLPVGSDVILSTFANATYTWWKDTETLRRFNVSYGAAAFALFNRLTTQLVARRTESDSPINNELRLRTAIRQDRVGLDGRVRLAGPWRLFGTVGVAETSYPERDELVDSYPELSNLERTEDDASIGVGYERPGRFRLDFGWRTIDTEFEDDPSGRSNRSDYPFARASFSGNRLSLDIEGGERRLDFDNPELGEQKQRTGLARTTLRLGHRTQTALYNVQSVVYSALDQGSYFASEATGIGLTWGVDQALSVSLFAETGTDDFVSAGGLNFGRIDDVDAIGLTVQFPARARLKVALGLSQIDVDSNLDEFDRSLTALRTSFRLSLPQFPF